MENVEAFMGVKFGIQTVNTKEPYGNVTISLRMKRNAILHTSMKTRLKFKGYMA